MKAVQARALAKYNQWMNSRLYQVCAPLSDTDRKKDRDAFFGSIHGTLNHLLLGDRIWLGRFSGSIFEVSSLDEELYENFLELRQQRAETDQDIIAWAETLTDDTLCSTFEFTSLVNPRARRCPLWVTVTHLFNHQTHHRGQVTTLLHQCGVDYGVTDFISTEGLIQDVT